MSTAAGTPAPTGQRRSWPLFTRAASAESSSAAQGSTLPVKVVVALFCIFLLATPLALLPLGAPQPAEHPPSWIDGPKYLLHTARSSLFGSSKPSGSGSGRAALDAAAPFEGSKAVDEDGGLPQLDTYKQGRSHGTRVGTAVQKFVASTGSSLAVIGNQFRSQLGLSKQLSLGDKASRAWYGTGRSVSSLKKQLAHSFHRLGLSKPNPVRHPREWLRWVLSKDRISQFKAQVRYASKQPAHLYSSAREGIMETGRLAGKGSRSAVHRLQRMARDFWDLVGPGGKLHPEEFLEHNGDVLVQLVLLGLLAVLLLQGAFKPSDKNKKDAPLSEKEIDQLCKEWQPEPLASLRSEPEQKPSPVIQGRTGVWVEVEGRKNSVLNMAGNDFLGMSASSAIEKACYDAIDKYGVGSCGPRGFYGTIDVHLEFEAKMAHFMGTEECILYSYDLATVPSVIPAFANAKDIIVCDEAVHYGAQNGCTLSRAKTYYFKHNDVADLESILARVHAEERRKKKPLNRRYIVTEGVFAATGELAPLAEIHRLKDKYKYRLLVDESFALGVLGQHGRGACEHAGLGPNDVEIVCASLGNAVGAVGGFCVGSRDVVDHQRLSGLGYCFSASLPPFLSSAAIAAMNQLEHEPQAMEAVQENARYLHDLLKSVPGIRVLGADFPQVPLLHLVLDPEPPTDGVGEGQLLQDLADKALDLGVLASVHRTSPLDRWQPRPSLRVTVTARHAKHDLDRAVKQLSKALQSVMNPEPTTPLSIASSQKFSPRASPSRGRLFGIGGGGRTTN
ncbi:hypothetical protein WJX73_006549 [Symbiochloris irregularis]|uniref:serine C-palmitoyltransferase n=1 Tax=Symbiochloris irregularis TaxID=706552 RepID=A0AAW1NX61_9CHLO